MNEHMEQHVERLVERVATGYFGKYRGTVTHVDADKCQIRATVPDLLGDQPCQWAMPAVPFAGKGYGMAMLPADGAAVWIEFEAGRLDKPIWTGAWWAGDRRPEPKSAKLRMIVSENGHKLTFDDDGDHIKLTHADGPEITLSADEIVLSCGNCELKISSTSISINDGQIKIGQQGVSLVNGSMSFGVAP